MKFRYAAAITVTLAGCGGGYDPPMTGDHARPSYQIALARCQKQAQANYDRLANATPKTAIVSMFQSGDAKRADIEACMKGRGYTPAS